MWDVVYDPHCYDTEPCEEIRNNAAKHIKAMAKVPDPRTYKDGKGGLVKALIGNLSGRFSFKPGTQERYEFPEHGNYRIEFKMQTVAPNGKVFEIDARAELRGKTRILTIIRIAHRGDSYHD